MNTLSSHEHVLDKKGGFRERGHEYTGTVYSVEALANVHRVETPSYKLAPTRATASPARGPGPRGEEEGPCPWRRPPRRRRTRAGRRPPRR
jgi:hypothetical protein